MDGSGGNRVAWADLPAPVRSWVAEVLGSPVVRAASQPGGFSPGSADRVVTAAGRRAFVKAVGAGLNAHSPALHRQEAAVAARLPDHPALPRLRATYDDGDWVALVLDDVDGRPPRRPWREHEVVVCLDALEAIADLPVPDGPPLPSLADDLTEAFRGWHHWAATEDRSGLDPWAAARLPRLADLADLAVEVADGEQLVHGDVRADNLLLRPDGTPVLVDWPHADRGAAWFDAVCLLNDVELAGGVDVDRFLRRGRLADVPPAHVAAVVTGLAAYFTWSASQPPVPGLPRVRRFQQVQGDAALRWLRRLWAP